jgi:hypothetical protein
MLRRTNIDHARGGSWSRRHGNCLAGAAIDPAPVVDLVEGGESLEVEIAATLLYGACHCIPTGKFGTCVASLPEARRDEIVDLGLRHRGRHDELLREFSAGQVVALRHSDGYWRFSRYASPSALHPGVCRRFTNRAWIRRFPEFLEDAGFGSRSIDQLDGRPLIARMRALTGGSGFAEAAECTICAAAGDAQTGTCSRWISPRRCIYRSCGQHAARAFLLSAGRVGDVSCSGAAAPGARTVFPRHGCRRAGGPAEALRTSRPDARSFRMKWKKAAPTEAAFSLQGQADAQACA